MSKTIQLTKGYEAIVDDEDFDELSKHKWTASVTGRDKTHIYATRGTNIGGKHKSFMMHRQILGAIKGQLVDHINGNPLDNRRCNLRITDWSGNSTNRCAKRSAAVGFKGVTKRKKSGMYFASIGIGQFHTAEEAALAYNKWASLIHGQYARLNVVPNSALGRESFVA